MQLFVHIQGLHTLEVTGQETVAQIKALTTLKAASCMFGGKDHDSLAHGGKVRGQTPKVAKQEKKKIGQANWQTQYNQSSVNVVLTFGKKGPNANS
uniref:40S ribosomal protein S30 n=1 Tax=Prolemur simus TaxID=1328070 RepID=A0A8C9AP63_PROSS